ncbi:hypothetical protein CLG96_15050 [Sphingomonas oleivorans]|uniref:DUF1318 domain-containing protein n=1 Tax=Sphingomonas oleivorans TaxID=1735121 RepID=A0A2T5FUW9_9SPHN|nr:YdbL family protein [Sphingomonas oleivorans]PTQ08521.1 hypothetical protein CLG96_15050 [Sphingomonas oleivorans]
MRRAHKILLATGIALAVAGGAGLAVAQGVEDPVIARARAAGIVGEQADGYLGFAKAPPADVKAAVDAVNIKRRQIYTDIAARQNATVQEVAAARGCDQLAKRVGPGEAYRAGDGTWKLRSGSAPVELPGVCG